MEALGFILQLKEPASSNDDNVIGQFGPRILQSNTFDWLDLYVTQYDTKTCNAIGQFGRPYVDWLQATFVIGDLIRHSSPTKLARSWSKALGNSGVQFESFY